MCYRTEKRWRCGCYTTYIIPCVDPDHCLTGVGGLSYSHACGGDSCSIRGRANAVVPSQEERVDRNTAVASSSGGRERALFPDQTTMREPELKPILSTKGEARSQESTAKWSPLSSALFTEKQDVRAPESHGTSSRKVKKVKSQDIRRIPFSIGGISEPTCGGSAEETYTPQRPQYRIPPPRQPSVALVSARQTQPQQELVSHDHPLLSHPTEAWWQSTQGSLSRRISLRGQGGKRNTMLKESPRKQTSSQNVTRSDSLQQGQRSASRQISVQQRATERSRIPQASLSDSLTIYTINQNEPSASQPRPSNNHDTRQEVCPQVTETHIRRESRTAGAITLMRWKTDEGSSSKPSKQ